MEQSYQALGKDDAIEAPISIIEACSRISWFYDQLLRNPATALAHFGAEEGVDQNPSILALRNLFLPARTPKPPSSSSPQARGTYTIGDRVEAKNPAASKLRNGNQFLMDEHSMNLQVERRRYPGEIVADNGDGTFTVQWDAWVVGSHGQLPSTDEVAMEDLLPAPDASLSAIDHALAAIQHKVGVLDVISLSFLGAVCAGAPYAYAKFLMRDACEEQGREGNYECTFHELSGDLGHVWTCFVLDDGRMCNLTTFMTGDLRGPLSVGIASLTLAAVMYALTPLVYKVCVRLAPVYAKRARRKVTTAGLDAIILTSLPGLVGHTESAVLICWASLGVSFTVLAILMLDVGILAFGSLVAAKFLFAANAICGRQAGVRLLHESKIISVAQEIRSQSDIDIDPEGLHIELSKFFAHPHDCEQLTMDVRTFVIIAAGVKVLQPDGIRIRQFLIERAYAEFVDEPAPDVPEFVRRRDVIVDIFDQRVWVPGKSLAGEWWNEQEEKGRWGIPWHLAVRSSTVVAMEQQLATAGCPKGRGCLTWRAEGGGRWAANEATDTYMYYGLAASEATRQKALNEALYNVIGMRDFKDNRDVVQALIAGGASVNYADSVNCSPLHVACWKGHLETAKALLDCRADIEQRGSFGTPFDMGRMFDQGAVVDQLEEYVCSTQAPSMDADGSRTLPIKSDGVAEIQLP